MSVVAGEASTAAVNAVPAKLLTIDLNYLERIIVQKMSRAFFGRPRHLDKVVTSATNQAASPSYKRGASNAPDRLSCF